MNVDLQDATSGAPVTGEQCSELTDLAAYLYAHLGLGADVELVISFVGEEQMEDLHIQWMGLNGSTDVMSFPMDQLRPGTTENPVGEGVLGDVVICPVVAQTQANAAGHGLGDELCLLVTHGVLHLLGYDHHDQPSRADMFQLQAQLLAGFLGRAAPVPTEAEAQADGEVR